MPACVLHDHEGPVQVPLWPAARGGPLRGAEVPLCPDSAAAVWDLLRRIEAHAEGRAHDTARAVLAHAPARWRQAFPGPERVIAYRMWLRYGDAFLRGALDNLVAAWWADGSPRDPDLPSIDQLVAAARWPTRLRRRLAQL
jgi:hypothetical protein